MKTIRSWFMVALVVAVSFAPAFLKDSGREGKSVAYTLTAQGSWVFLFGRPVQKNGKAIDYMGTKYEQDIAEGMFDDNLMVLLKKSGSSYRVVELAVGSTDFPAEMWMQKHKFPSSLLQSASGE